MDRTTLKLRNAPGTIRTMRPTGRCLTPEQAAEKLNVTVRQLKEWRLRREGPHFFYVGYRRPRYPEMWIDEWINQRVIITEEPSNETAIKLIGTPTRP